MVRVPVDGIVNFEVSLNLRMRPEAKFLFDSYQFKR